MNVNVEVSTVKSRHEYYATVTDADNNDRRVGKYNLMLSDDLVTITTTEYMLGHYRIERFSNELSPTTIRKFFIDAMAESPKVSS